jgi:hypothetical protein
MASTSAATSSVTMSEAAVSSMSLTISGYLRRESGSLTILLALALSPSAILRMATKRGSDSSISSSAASGAEAGGLEEMLAEGLDEMLAAGLLAPMEEMDAGLLDPMEEIEAGLLLIPTELTEVGGLASKAGLVGGVASNAGLLGGLASKAGLLGGLASKGGGLEASNGGLGGALSKAGLEPPGVHEAAPGLKPPAAGLRGMVSRVEAMNIGWGEGVKVSCEIGGGGDDVRYFASSSCFSA